MWEDCQLDLFWKTLLHELKKSWINRGEPIIDHVIQGGYPELKIGR